MSDGYVYKCPPSADTAVLEPTCSSLHEIGNYDLIDTSYTEEDTPMHCLHFTGRLDDMRQNAELAAQPFAVH